MQAGESELLRNHSQGTNPNSSTCKLISRSPFPKRLAQYLLPELDEKMGIKYLDYLVIFYLLCSSQNPDWEQEASHQWASPQSASLGHPMHFRWPRRVHAGTSSTTSTGGCRWGNWLIPEQSHISQLLTNPVEQQTIQTLYKAFTDSLSAGVGCVSYFVPGASVCTTLMFVIPHCPDMAPPFSWPETCICSPLRRYNPDSLSTGTHKETTLKGDHSNPKSGQWLFDVGKWSVKGAHEVICSCCLEQELACFWNCSIDNTTSLRLIGNMTWPRWAAGWKKGNFTCIIWQDVYWNVMLCGRLATISPITFGFVCGVRREFSTLLKSLSTTSCLFPLSGIAFALRNAKC